MAIKLTDKPNTEAPSANYPYGNIVDNDGSLNGTPVNKLVYADLHQFFERLMALAGVTHNGLPENNSNGFQLTQALDVFARALTADTTQNGTVTRATIGEVNTQTDIAKVVTPKTLSDTYGVVHNSGTERLTKKIVSIGDWDMDSSPTTTIAHGLSDFTKIKAVEVMILNDAGNAIYPLNLYNSTSGTDDISGGVKSIDATDIVLSRRVGSGSFFGSNDFDATSYNRGFITFTIQTN
jgi:hypothetical protein